ncbi:MAG: HvfC family RiPP maturation protein, partial [Solimonas sp.]
ALRDAAAAPPSGMPAGRLTLYRRLIDENLERGLARAFPVLRRVLGESGWRDCRTAFFARHRCRTPQFRWLGDEFLAFVEADGGSGLPPFAAALAHYEWMEARLAAAPDEVPDDDAGADPLAGVPQCSSLAWLFAYDWPVHRIGAGTIPAAPLAVPVFLLLNRDRDDAVHFLEVDALGAVLIDSLRQSPQRSGRQHLSSLARRHGLPEAAALETGAALLATLRARDAVFVAAAAP